jgi:ribosomal protein L21E
MKYLNNFDQFITEKKKSPFKKATLKKYVEKYEDGEEIPVMIQNTLKAQGLIPRANGEIEVSDEYKEDSILPDLKPREKKETKKRKSTS